MAGAGVGAQPELRREESGGMEQALGDSGERAQSGTVGHVLGRGQAGQWGATGWGPDPPGVPVSVQVPSLTFTLGQW